MPGERIIKEIVSAIFYRLICVKSYHYARKSEGVCFYRRWFVCLFVCYHDN